MISETIEPGQIRVPRTGAGRLRGKVLFVGERTVLIAVVKNYNGEDCYHEWALPINEFASWPLEEEEKLPEGVVKDLDLDRVVYTDFAGDKLEMMSIRPEARHIYLLTRAETGDFVAIPRDTLLAMLELAARDD